MAKEVPLEQHQEEPHQDCFPEAKDQAASQQGPELGGSR